MNNGPAFNPPSFGARDAQPLESLIAGADDMLRGLWEKPNAKDLPPFARAAIEERERVNAAAARLFAGAEGEALLEHLCDVAVRRTLFVTQLGVDPQQALLYGAFREGQAALLFYLLSLIAAGRGEQAPQREGLHHATRRSKVSSEQRPAPARGRRRQRRRK